MEDASTAPTTIGSDDVQTGASLIGREKAAGGAGARSNDPPQRQGLPPDGIVGPNAWAATFAS
jgi:hypothetical protein